MLETCCKQVGSCATACACRNFYCVGKQGMYLMIISGPRAENHCVSQTGRCAHCHGHGWGLECYSVSQTNHCGRYHGESWGLWGDSGLLSQLVQESLPYLAIVLMPAFSLLYLMNSTFTFSIHGTPVLIPCFTMQCKVK